MKPTRFIGGSMVLLFLLPLSFASGSSHNAIRLLAFNRALSPVSDVRIRRAIAQAIDRQALIAMNPGTEIATGVNPPGSPVKWSRKVSPYAFDREQARRLLQEAGAGQFTLTITGGRNLEQMLRKIASDLASLGIQTNINLVGTLDELRSVSRAGRSHLLLVGTLIDPRSANERMTVQLWDFYRGSNMDLYHYTNPEFDRLLEQAQAASGEQKSDLYRRAEELLITDVVVVPLFFFVAN